MPFSAKSDELKGLLADTWWFGLTKRLSPDAFIELAQLRRRQGFSAIQIVVGIPPEVGPENENASSDVGPAWALQGEYNQAYLNLAQERIATLVETGLTPIIYGAWGHQIEWLGPERMIGWWTEIVKAFDRQRVIYCLTGESNLWVGEAMRLLPDLTTGDLITRHGPGPLPARAHVVIRRFLRRVRRSWKRPHPDLVAKRQGEWSIVLAAVKKMTERPVILHPVAGQMAYDAVDDPRLLSANTVQTGHSESTRSQIWSIPARCSNQSPGALFINLEPWYEGITDNFYAEQQLYAYWAGMLAGADSHCYGAHGIWNVGDGHFLAHWGTQTYATASALDTPRLLGLSHALFCSYELNEQAKIETQEGELLSITRAGPEAKFAYYPEVSFVRALPEGEVWLPLEGKFVDRAPSKGQVVIIGPRGC